MKGAVPAVIALGAWGIRHEIQAQSHTMRIDAVERAVEKREATLDSIRVEVQAIRVMMSRLEERVGK